MPTADKPRRLPLLCDRGEGLKLRKLLEHALGIPAHARGFTVKFEREQAVIVTVEYIPHHQETDPCSS